VESDESPYAAPPGYANGMTYEHLLRNTPLPWSVSKGPGSNQTIKARNGLEVGSVFWNTGFGPGLALMICALVNQAANSAGMTALADETIPAAGD
jgi:hypothetical protein